MKAEKLDILKGSGKTKRNYTESADRPYAKLLPDAVAQAGGGGGRGKAGTVIWR